MSERNKRDWTEADRALLEKRAHAYLGGFELLGIGPDKHERAEFADLCIKQQVTMHEAVDIYTKSRMPR